MKNDKTITIDYDSKIKNPKILNTDHNTIFTQLLYKDIFDCLPNYFSLDELDFKNDIVLSNFLEKFSSDITKTYKNEVYDKEAETKKNLFQYVFIFAEKIIVSFSVHSGMVILYNEESNLKEALIEFGIQNIKYNKEAQISLIVLEYGNLEMKAFPIKIPKLKIESHYNDDFLPIHNRIMERLSIEKESGLILLHGKPGTGKTYYLRYLTTVLKKKVFFVPVNIFPQINNPDFLSFLYNHSNSIMIIEDAEKLIMERGNSNMDSVSSILNLTDGLLSDCLNIQVICSFNTDLNKIDKALLRKGRLIARYHFSELTLDKTKALSEHLGYTDEINSPMTLSEIYTLKEEEYNVEPKQTSIGFKK